MATGAFIGCQLVRFTYHSTSFQERPMHTLAASEARANLYRLIDEAAESHKPITISGKRSSAVPSLRKIGARFKKPCICFAVPGMRESIKTGMAGASRKQCSGA